MSYPISVGFVHMMLHSHKKVISLFLNTGEKKGRYKKMGFEI